MEAIDSNSVKCIRTYNICITQLRREAKISLSYHLVCVCVCVCGFEYCVSNKRRKSFALFVGGLPIGYLKK